MNNIIAKRLKDYEFEYDPEYKRLRLMRYRTEEFIEIDRIRMFSLARFILRIAQKSVKRRKI